MHDETTITYDSDGRPTLHLRKTSSKIYLYPKVFKQITPEKDIVWFPHGGEAGHVEVYIDAGKFHSDLDDVGRDDFSARLVDFAAT